MYRLVLNVLSFRFSALMMNSKEEFIQGGTNYGNNEKGDNG